MSLPVVALVLLIVAGVVAVTALGVGVIERRHPPSGIFVPVAGGRLHIVELKPTSGTADGQAVVLLHGASGNLEDMRLALGERLAGRHRVILIDRPGHGWSDRPDGDAEAAPARQASRVAEVLDRLGVGRVIVVGHSWSGALATAFALAYPGRVAGLVLLAPVTHPWPGGIAWYYRVATTPILGPLFARTLALPLGLIMLDGGSTGVFAPQRKPAGYVARAAIALSLRPPQFLANARDRAELKGHVAAQAPRYRDIAAPVVIITGDRDRTVSPRIHAQALAAALPHAKLILLPGIGHMPHHVAPDLVAAEVGRLAAAAVPGLIRVLPRR